MLNEDYRDILSELSASGADYLLVGAYALASHGLVRATSAQLFTQPDQVLQIGVAPLRIDLLTSVSGLEFDAAWARREMVDLGGLTVPVLSLEDLATNKRATGRPQDLVDLRWIDESRS
jgi:hypothetical protein